MKSHLLLPCIEECKIQEFCDSFDVKPVNLARMCGVNKEYINNLKNRSKHPHIIRYNSETGDIELIKTEKVMCHGNLNRER